METMDYFMGLDELHYLAMVVTVCILLNAIYMQWKTMVALTIVSVIFYDVHFLWLTSIVITPLFSAIALLGFSIYTTMCDIRSNSVNLKKILGLFLANIVLILSAIGGMSYGNDQYTKEMKELLPICKTTNLEEIRKTGGRDEFVKKCEKALSHETNK